MAEAKPLAPLVIEERSSGEAVETLRESLSLPTFFARVLSARGIRSVEDVDLSLGALLPPTLLANVDRAAARLVAAIRGDERILVIGDFDADGATASALVVSLLGAMGARQVDYLVPNRFEFGYGLTPEIVRIAIERGPAVIMTVDNGISSLDGVRVANESGIDVLVTDHHLAPAQLPAAYAIVNPNQRECEFPSGALAGVGVAYYVLSVVRAQLRDAGYFEQERVNEPNLGDWLDLVALGTVADVVPLDRNNRILVHNGLRRMRAGRVRPGIKALCEVAGRPLDRLTAQDLGFGLGPRLNAAGRLDDISIGIQCLLAEDIATARSLAIALDELNKARREIEDDMNADAQILIAGTMTGEDPGLCVYDPSWHQGVIGIVAGRMRERFHRPVVAFADAGDAAPAEIKGSARSVPGVHVRDAIDDVATRYPGLVEKFGGHAMAAGLSIKRIHFERFQRAFADAVQDRANPRDLMGIQSSDGELSATEMSLQSAHMIAGYGPWGQAFEEPMFHGDFDLVSQREVGGGRHLKLVLKSGDRLMDAIAFNQTSVDARRVKVMYRLDINHYADADTLQLVVEHIEALQ